MSCMHDPNFDIVWKCLYEEYEKKNHVAYCVMDWLNQKASRKSTLGVCISGIAAI